MIDIGARTVITNTSGSNNTTNTTDITASLLGCITNISCIKRYLNIIDISTYRAYPLYRLGGNHAFPA